VYKSVIYVSKCVTKCVEPAVRQVKLVGSCEGVGDSETARAKDRDRDRDKDRDRETATKTETETETETEKLRKVLGQETMQSECRKDSEPCVFDWKTNFNF